ncbi:LADA_0E03114g1_1 [Lachancea dasiensis]|uniref:D-xylose 1-dehydrogenase (NADP(+), D-xylono-1,5-lactone-forming) n=1 Tax=Lachancea dasiensis TaxID=1072105 RepID=A0A1G4JB40_9SACH|nr:LADA_0E03114g1_1 [Lachancea dasiensis]
MVYTVKWGILACGGIAEQFSVDLLTDPHTRNVHDVKHEIAAVASSTSVEKARSFIKRINGPPTIKPYGSYEELAADPDVDIIYVATPHAYHYANTKLALEHGKPVLCEKPFTINATQAKKLFELAESKNLFLMEAVWTRFFPLVYELQRLLFEEKILGKVQRVFADASVPFGLNDLPETHRMLNPDLGGGALLDLGIYALTWIFITCFEDPDNEGQLPIVTSGMLKTKTTNVDESTNISLIFPASHVAAVATTNMVVKTDPDRVCLIQGEKGNIAVHWPPFHPDSFEINLYPDGTKEEDKMTTKLLPPKLVNLPSPGKGMFWEADECARCLRDGKIESSRVPHSYTLIVMELMDKVRKDNELSYSAAVEAAD